jgi:hypothetical protein
MPANIQLRIVLSSWLLYSNIKIVASVVAGSNPDEAMNF